MKSLSYLLVVSVIFCAPAACQQLNYELRVQRADNEALNREVDIITLQCVDLTTGSAINLRQNEDVRFWLNRLQPDDAGLRSRFTTDSVRLTPDGMGILFALRRVGEGNYTCGVQLNEGNVDESVLVRLIALQTVFNSLFITATTSFFVASGNSVTLQCPVQPGNLYKFYYGRWTRNGTVIINIARPSTDGMPSEIQGNETKYTLDRQTFSLTIRFADASTDASSNYRCELRNRNPLTGNSVSFSQAAGLDISLMVNEAPTILSKPEPLVVGLQEASANPPTFTCSLGGAPEPILQWTYIPNLSGSELVLTPGEDYNITLDIEMEDNGSGRSVVSSTLKFLSITNTDGGIVRCKAVSNGNSASADALLTILGEPENIEVVLSREDGVVIYEVDLAVEMNSPFKLNATYTNRENTSHSMITDTIYNNTKSVSHRDVIGQLRDEVYFISFSLVAEDGSDRISGPLKQRDEIIDTTTTPSLLIIIPSTVVGAIVLFITLVVLIAIILLAVHKKEKLVFQSIELILKDPDKYMDKVKLPQDKNEREEYMKQVRSAHLRLIRVGRRRIGHDGDGDEGGEDNTIEFMTEVFFDSYGDKVKSDIKSKLSQALGQQTAETRHDTEERAEHNDNSVEHTHEATASDTTDRTRDAFQGPGGAVHIEIHGSTDQVPHTLTLEQPEKTTSSVL